MVILCFAHSGETVTSSIRVEGYWGFWREFRRGPGHPVNLVHGIFGYNGSWALGVCNLEIGWMSGMSQTRESTSAYANDLIQPLLVDKKLVVGVRDCRTERFFWGLHATILDPPGLK